jgi:hypothetical protein
MNPVGNSHLAVYSVAQFAASKTRALQKLNSASGLHGEAGDDAEPDSHSFHNSRKQALSRSGTDLAVPFRYSAQAPRLNAAFVAQLLGQALPDHEPRQVDMRTVYQDAASAARLCDTRL